SELLLCHGMVCVVGRMRDLILQLSKSSIYSTKPSGMSWPTNRISTQRQSIISAQAAAAPTKNKKLFSTIINTTILFVASMLGDENVISVHIVPYKCGFLTFRALLVRIQGGISIRRYLACCCGRDLLR
ncbi:hypothetical protein ACB364_20495, partial [Enterobacter hormaechei]